MTMRLVRRPPPLVQVGQLAVDRRALDHYYVHEVRTCTEVLDGRLDNVIGTTNDMKAGPTVELYGWSPNVKPHADKLGIIYFMPLVVRLSRVHACYAGAATSIWLQKGGIYRLNDFSQHWTQDAGPAVCLYTGIYRAPADAAAIAALGHGLEQLARGDRDAPRCSPGFRVPAAWECYIEHEGGHRLVPIIFAKSEGKLIAACAECPAPAWYLDNLFPWHQEANRCRKHFTSAPVPKLRFSDDGVAA